MSEEQRFDQKPVSRAESLYTNAFSEQQQKGSLFDVVGDDDNDGKTLGFVLAEKLVTWPLRNILDEQRFDKEPV